MNSPKKVLTEQVIKKEAMAFLKGFYKYKPRGEGGTIVKYDMRAEGGLIADGYLEFNDLDGGLFTATLEASSASKRDEVAYRIQHRLLFWDCLSVSFLMTITSLILFQRYEVLDYSTLNLSMGLFFSWGFLLVYFLIFRLSLQFLKRYRYIYAIEQFSKYKVDEKWICISDDVFPNGSDKYFKELKKRCILDGVGLLKINADLRVSPIVVAAKQERKINLERTAFKDLDVWVNTVGKKVGITKDLSMMRFAPKYYLQQVIIGFCLFFISVLMYDKYEKFRHIDTNADEILEEVYQRNSNQVPEPEAYQVVESAMNQYGKQIDYVAPRDDTLKNAYEDWAISQVKLKNDSIKVNKTFKEKPTKGLDSCSKWNGLGKGYYLIIKGVFNNEREALDQQLFVSREYDGVGILPAYCLDSKDSHYFVYVGKPTRDARSAEQLLNRMNHDENHVLKPKEKRFSLISL
jgi:hypothetical protein